MPRLLTCLLLCLVFAIVQADATSAEAAPAKKAVPALRTLIHDLRDFLPEAEATTGNADDPIPGFSCKDDGYWKNYRSYNKNGSGYLSRTEIIALVADLVKELRADYPDVFAEIDSDGAETITLAKFTAYQSAKQKK